MFFNVISFFGLSSSHVSPMWTILKTFKFQPHCNECNSHRSSVITEQEKKKKTQQQRHSHSLVFLYCVKREKSQTLLFSKNLRKGRKRSLSLSLPPINISSLSCLSPFFKTLARALRERRRWRETALFENLTLRQQISSPGRRIPRLIPRSILQLQDLVRRSVRTR